MRSGQPKGHPLLRMTFKSRIIFVGIGLLAFAVYISTLAPSITWRNNGADSGDLATAVAVEGIPHPPGYPTYLILGEAFKLLPFGDIAYRLNLLSATSAALTVTLMAGIIYHTLSATSQGQIPPKEPAKTRRLMLSCAGSTALVLAFSSTFWSQAVIAEVYALNGLFVALLLYGVLQVNFTNQRWLAPGLLGLLGLSLGGCISPANCETDSFADWY